MMKLNELSDRLDWLRASLDELRAELDTPSANPERLRELAAGHRKAIAALQEDFLGCYIEINEPVRLANRRLEILNGDFLNARAEHTLLEERVSRLEEAA